MPVTKQNQLTVVVGSDSARQKRHTPNSNYAQPVSIIRLVPLLLLMSSCLHIWPPSSTLQVHAAVHLRMTTKSPLDYSDEANDYTTTTKASVKMMQNQAKPSPAPKPVCELGDDRFQIGQQWTPSLPNLGLQLCLKCECTLRLRPQTTCYDPKVTCIRNCPSVSIDKCPDGSELKVAPGECCQSCVPTKQADPASSSSSSSSPSPSTSSNRNVLSRATKYTSSMWKTSNSRAHQQRAPLNPPDLGFDQSTSQESFWLFKIVAKSNDNREIISAVKSVSMCRPTKNPIATTTSSPDDLDEG